MSTKAIHEAVVTLLKGINGPAGGYTYNLSADDQITWTGRLNEEMIPGCTVFLESIDENDGPELGAYEETATFTLNALAPATEDTAISRIKAAEDLLDDLRKALRANRSLGGLVNDLRLSVAAVDGAEVGYKLYGVVIGALIVRWWEGP